MISIHDFNVGSSIYSNGMAMAYINIFKPEAINVDLNDDLVQQNITKKEWFNQNFSDGISIADVIEKPEKHRNHYDRMVKADMQYPIIIWKEKKLVTDGNHRLGHAHMNGHTRIKAFVLDNEIMNKVKLGKFKTPKEYAEVISKYNLNTIIELFYKNFCH